MQPVMDPWWTTCVKRIMPLVYMTETSRSYDLKEIRELHHFSAPQPEFAAARPKGDIDTYNTINERSCFRVFLKTSPSKQADWPRLDKAMAVRGLLYGLINVRTDGKDLMFAAMEEKGKDWSVTVLTDQQIDSAEVVPGAGGD